MRWNDSLRAPPAESANPRATASVTPPPQSSTAASNESFPYIPILKDAAAVRGGKQSAAANPEKAGGVKWASLFAPGEAVATPTARKSSPGQAAGAPAAGKPSPAQAAGMPSAKTSSPGEAVGTPTNRKSSPGSLATTGKQQLTSESYTSGLGNLLTVLKDSPQPKPPASKAAPSKAAASSQPASPEVSTGLLRPVRKKSTPGAVAQGTSGKDPEAADVEDIVMPFSRASRPSSLPPGSSPNQVKPTNTSAFTPAKESDDSKVKTFDNTLYNKNN